MKFYLFVLTLTFFPNVYSLIHNQDEKWDSYLIKRFKTLNNKLKGNIRYIRDINQEYSMETDILGSYSHSDSSINVNTFTFKGKTYFFINNEIFLANLDKYLVLKPLANFTDQKDTLFFKAIDYQNLAIIVQQIIDDTVIYIFNDNLSEPKLIQKIVTPFASDCLLFINEDNLYLVMSTHHGDHIAYFTVYKWLGSYFDELKIVYTTSINALGSFTYKNVEIIVTLQSEMLGKTYSSVYEFKSDDIKKIQHLSTISPQRMDVFIQNKSPYILIYEEFAKQLFYKWNGFEMVLVNTFQWKHRVDKSMVVYNNLAPIIVLPQLKDVLIFKPNGKEITLEGTKNYLTIYSSILNINNGRNENGNITFIVGLTEDNIINIYAMSFKPTPEIESEQVDSLGNCFNNLEQNVYDQKQKINQMKRSLFPSHSQENSKQKKREIIQNNTMHETDIENKLEDIKGRLDKIRPFKINHEDSANSVTINIKITINDYLLARTVKAQSMEIEQINGKIWTPEKLLKIKGNQIISGAVNADVIKTKILRVDPDKDTLFKNLLLKNGNQRIFGKYIINNIVANNIKTNKINNINIKNIYRKSDLPVKGQKSFKNVDAVDTYVQFINNISTDSLISLLNSQMSVPKINFAPEISINNLVVETIDDINWEEFKNSVYRIGQHMTIQGNITIPALKSKKITVKYINGINADHLMTKTTDQLIDTSIEFNYINASNIQCNTINDIDITRTVRTNQNRTIVTGPVRLQQAEVKGDLELIGNISKGIFFKNSERTIQSDFLQIYNGKVIIKGNLYVQNLTILPNATMFINGNEQSISVLNEYWTKNSDQVIPVHFEALNGISVPHLIVKLLNNIAINDFAINDERESLKGPFFFENVVVNGNVSLNKSIDNNGIDLRNLATNSVRLDNETYIINGKKIFKGNLKVKNLKTNRINKYKVQKNDHSNLSEQKILKKLIIKGDLQANVQTDVINKININELKQKLLSIDKPENISNIEFKYIKVENLYTDNINGFNISDYPTKIQNLLEQKNFRELNFTGNVTIHNVQNVSTINNHNIVEFLNKESLDRVNVKFLGKTKIRNLQTEIINNMNLTELTRRLLYKKSQQNITGFYTFNNLKTKDLYVNKINELDVKNLIDITYHGDQKIELPLGSSFKNTVFKKSLTASSMSPCDLYKTVSNIQYPETTKWSKIEIEGDLSILDEQSLLRDIIFRTVKKNEENIITAPVRFAGHVLTNRVQAFNTVNNINLTQLIDDAVLNESEEEQVISITKIFSNIEAETATVLNNADIPVVNNINIAELYKRIIKKNEVQDVQILGKKIFYAGLQTDRFLTNKISGIDPAQIVDVENMKKIPSALFDNLEVKNNLEVMSINNFNLDYILQNRLLTNITGQQTTKAVYYFGELEAKEGIKTVKINDIDINRVIFDVGKQKIMSTKQFKRSISIVGNVEIESINGVDITQAYNDALIRRRNKVINGSLTITKPVVIDGNITAETINGYPIEKIIEIMNNTSEEESIYNMTEKLKRIVSDSIPIVQHMPNELMYIEKSDDLQIRIKDTIDAAVITTNDYVLMHILGEESNEICHLPKGCKCPVQHTIEISPHNSVTHILDNQQQRMYSYDDDTMTIHIITNSISMDSYCRSNNSDYSEVIIMNWSTKKIGNVTGSFNIFTTYFSGYLSGAQFFTLNGITYTIIARYYDAAVNSYDLDCTVMRFSKDKTTAMEIQNIPTKGVWTIYILHTAQGIILVIGNIATESSTEIYLFQEHLQKFELLRKVPYASTKIAGVVLGIDSLIILANQNDPLQVLKYDHNFGNYYYYQTFHFDEQVMGMSVFYVGGFGISDAYLAITTEDSYRIYSFQYIDGWKLEISGTIKGLKNLIPVELNKQLYLFAPSDQESSLLTVIKHGAGET